jgi:hypothetical protein
MKHIAKKVSLITVLSLCIVGSYSLPTPKAQTRVDPDAQKKAEAEKLQDVIRQNYKQSTSQPSEFPGTSVRLSVATKRYDNETALVAIQINTDDPALTADVPQTEFVIQPAQMTKPDDVKPLGTPSTVHIGRSGPSDGSLIRQLSSVISAPTEANAVTVSMKVMGNSVRGLTFNASLNEDASVGTATIHAPITAAAIQRLSPAIRALFSNSKCNVQYVKAGFTKGEASALSSTPAVQYGCCNVPVSINCGGGNCSANCNTCNPENQPKVTCTCSGSPPTCTCSISCKSATC